MAAPPRCLVYGYGNPGRRDDGLGPEAARVVASWGLPHVTVESGYQLSVEDAHTLSLHDAVLFVDADATDPRPFYLRSVEPRRAVSFSSHSVRPEALVALSLDLFHATVPCWILGIRGLEFMAFGEGLTERAREHLADALRFLRPHLECGDLEAAARAAPPLPAGAQALPAGAPGPGPGPDER